MFEVLDYKIISLVNIIKKIEISYDK